MVNWFAIILIVFCLVVVAIRNITKTHIVREDIGIMFNAILVFGLLEYEYIPILLIACVIIFIVWLYFKIFKNQDATEK